MKHDDIFSSLISASHAWLRPARRPKENQTHALLIDFAVSDSGNVADLLPFLSIVSVRVAAFEEIIKLFPAAASDVELKLKEGRNENVGAFGRIVRGLPNGAAGARGASLLREGSWILVELSPFVAGAPGDWTGSTAKDWTMLFEQALDRMRKGYREVSLTA